MQKLISMLQEKFIALGTLEQQKKVLSYHQTFNIGNLFSEIDVESKGFLAILDLEKYFGNVQKTEKFDFQNILQFWQTNLNSGKLTFDDFNKALLS